MNMKFIAEELGIINFALNLSEGKTRTFSVGELAEVGDIAKKLKEATQPVEQEGRKLDIFVDSEVAFTSAQNVMLTNYIKIEKWDASQAEYVLSVIEKLK